jgi:hypothetical protein
MPRLVGVSIRSGFPVFGQNRELEPGTPVLCFEQPKPGSRLLAGFGCTRSGNRFFKKIIFLLILGIEPKIYKFCMFECIMLLCS